MNDENIDYSILTKEELISKVKELSSNRYIVSEQVDSVNRMETPWTGNLGKWQWDLKNNKITCDGKKTTALGYSISELPKEIGFEFFTEKLHPSDYDDVMKNMRLHLTGESNAFEVEYRIKTKNGDYIWFYDRGTITEYDNNGKASLVRGIVFDITKRKKLEEENKLLARLPFLNPDIVVIVNRSGIPLFINPAGKKIIKKDISEILPSNFYIELEKAFESISLITLNYKINDKHYVFKIRSFEDEDQCMITISDIIEAVEIEEDRKLYYDALQSIKQAIFITDIEGNILKVNKEFEKLYGYSNSEMMGKNPRTLNAGIDTYINLGYSNEKYNDLFSGLWNSLLDPNIGKWEGTVINRSKEGKIMWINSVTNAIYNFDNKIVNFVSLPINITNSFSNIQTEKRRLYLSLAELAELRDNETGAHMRRVGIYSRLIAKNLGMPNKFCDDIEIFAPMHDLGKVGVGDSILLAPRKLTYDEFEIMKNHTKFGFNIVKNNEDMQLVADVTLSHHEKFDGSGYPHGKKGEEIPIAARIVALADVYDALRSKRPYKIPWSHEKSKEYILSNRGKHFDPEIVDVFSKLNQQMEQIYGEIED
ncbi:MAG: HD domain-containing phosphohydrolase [Acidaminobacteraceae bacterium]